MRIAIFADSFYPNLGGLEDSTAILARSLGEGGHQVSIWAPKFTRNYYRRRQLTETELDLGPNVRIFRLFSLPLPDWIFSARLVVSFGAGYRLLKSDRPDLIHTQTIFGAGLEALWASHWLKVPLVGTNHSITSEFGVYFPFARKIFIRIIVGYETWFYNHCSIVTTPSRVATQAMQQNGLICPTRVISNIIDTDNFKPLADPLAKERLKSEFDLIGRPIISFAGRFAIEKRVEILLQAINLVRQRFPQVVLALAGSGIQRQNWQKIIDDLDLQNNVKFVGTLNKPQLANLFQASEIFAIASAIESQGMVALQAMACGLPVVGVNGRAIPEYVDETNGYIVPVDDYRAMAEKLVKLLRDPERAQELGKNARQKVEKYAKQNIIKEWEEVYNLALNQNEA